MLRVRQVSDITLSVTDTSIFTSVDGTSSISAATSALTSETTLPSTSSLVTSVSDPLTTSTDSPTTSYSSAQPTTTLHTTTPTSSSPTSTFPSSTPTSSSSTLSPTPSTTTSTNSPPSATTTPPGIPTTITSSYVTVIGGSTYTVRYTKPHRKRHPHPVIIKLEPTGRHHRWLRSRRCHSSHYRRVHHLLCATKTHQAFTHSRCYHVHQESGTKTGYAARRRGHGR
ncbi:hypothetical protein PISMIDRAFT_537178 [Pisolithus microcarpus 441]|uniref:Uncharacterized protein n=1 Tax=Pisolithus microcarpus 441 TaxID=765257 RepID=A0A0C9YAK9_9AGAM|nr:hypothetical protein PISMIDRAFT_537178 [Pisolithus microcarpus 441]